jgi:predicted dehydrogenase
VLSNGCHAFDLVYWLNESEPVRISAEGGALVHPEIGLVDNAAVAVQFANGSIAAIIAGDAGDTPYASKFFFEVLDGRRTATLYDRCHRVSFWGCEREALSVDDLPPEARDDPEGVRGELRAFATCLLEGKDPPVGRAMARGYGDGGQGFRGDTNRPRKEVLNLQCGVKHALRYSWHHHDAI